MPTGYTADIKDGISFKEFVLNCSRAFGALVHLRDTPDAEIPDEVEPSDYHKKQIAKQKSKLKKVNQMEDEEILQEWRQMKEDAIARAKERIKESRELREKYADMLVKVQEWEPPTPDHNNLKEFMIDQLERSIQHDCSTKYPKERLEEWQDKEEPSAYSFRQEKIEMIKDNIKYHEKKWKKEKERAKDKTEWIRELKKSIDEL